MSKLKKIKSYFMKKGILFCCIMLASLSVWSQYTVVGKVISAADNKGMAGATVSIKNTSINTVSHEGGAFSLRTSDDRVILHVSYIGYEPQEIALTLPLNQAVVFILVPGLNQLQEVSVSTGYHEIPKERSTGSFEVISKELLNEQVSTTLLGRLEAVANGLTVDRATNAAGRIMIRGLSTIRGPKEPLIVLDNFPYEGNLDNINPNDVESITILKDAAAASIWGTRAGNGVIVITTKKGRMNQPLTVDFNSSLSVQDKPDLSYSPQIASADFIDVEQLLFTRGYYNSQINSTSRPVLSPVVELLMRRVGASIAEQARIDAEINSLRSMDVRNDFERFMYSSGVNQQYAIGVRGGSQLTAWNASAGYDKNINNLAADYDRLNLKLQNILKPAKGLEFSASLMYTLSNSTSGKPGYGNVDSRNGNLYPYAQFAAADGTPLAIERDYRYSYLQGLGNGKLQDWRYFPLEDYKHSITENKIADLLLNTGASYSFGKALRLDLKYQFERQQSGNRNLNDEDSYYARNLVNVYSQIPVNSANIAYVVPPGGILNLSNTILNSHNTRAQFNFTQAWGKHTIDALAGAEARNAVSNSNGYNVYGYNERTLSSGEVDRTITYPSIVNGSRSFIPGGNSFYGSTGSYTSLFSNAAYNYDSRYELSVSLRRDASNLFGVSTNERWTPLGSAGIGWVVSNESFYNPGFLPYLKFRASYGFSGNSDPGMTGLTTISYANNSPYTLTPVARFDNYANPEVQWETVGMMNAGIDFQTGNSRLSGSLEFYTKKGTNLFASYPIDYTAGVGFTILRNVASMKGRGIDLDLTSMNTTGRFKWSTQWNLSYYTDHVEDYYLPSLQASRFVQADAVIAGVKGKPVYSVFSYRWAGLDPLTGDPRGYANGAVSKDYNLLVGSNTTINDLNYHGSALPVFFGSLGNTFGYKNFTLSARVSFKANYYFRAKSIEYNSLYSSMNGHTDFALRWQKAGDETVTTVPSMIYPITGSREAFYKFSEALVERGDHVRFQYINLAYSPPRLLLDRLSLKQTSIYLNLNNVGILWRANKKGLDPEYITSAFTLPPAKTFSVGLRTNL